MKVFFSQSVKKLTLVLATILASLLQTNQGHAQIILRANATATSSSTSLTINKPSGLVAGDLMIANITQRNSENDATSTGWTKLTSYLVGSANRWATILYKVATSSDVTATDFTFTITGANATAGGISAFSGVETTTTGGIEVTGTSNNGNSTGPIAPAQITTSSNNAMVLFLGQINGTGVTFTAGNWSVGSNNMTQAYTVSHATLEPSAGLAYYTQATSGATGAGSKAISASSRWGGILLSLKPLPVFSVTAGSLSHGSSCLNTAATKITYTITNNTSSAITGLSVTSNSAEFVVSNAPSSLTANGTATYDVTFTPTSSGSRTASIKIKSTSPLDSITSSLTGTGDQPTVTFTSSPTASTLYNQDVTYTTQASQTNYVWSVPGTLNTDYSITSGGIGSSSNTVVLKWLTAGSKTVTVNYTNSNGCTASTAASSQTTVTLGTNRYAVATGNWNATSTWAASSRGSAGASIPSQYDTVFVGDDADFGYTVTIPTTYNAACAKINLGTKTDNNCNLTLASSSSTLTTSSDINIIRNTSGGGKVSSLNVNAGTVTVGGNINFDGVSTDTDKDAKVVLTTGILNVTGNIVFNTSNSANPETNEINLGSGASVNLSGNFTLTNSLGKLTPGTSSTFNFNSSSSAQTIPVGVSAVVYNNLSINNTSAGGASLSAAITSSNVTGNLSVQSGTLNNGGYAITLASGKNFSVSNGATFNLSGTSSMASVSGVGTKTFGSTSIVNYSGTNQTVTAETYGHLNFSGSGTKTMPSAYTTVAGNFTTSGTISATALDTMNVSGNFTLGSGTTFTAGAFTHAVGGNWINNGTFTAGTSTINFNGTSAISGSSTSTFNNLTISASSSLTSSSGNVNISGNFTNNGTFNHNSGTITLSGGGGNNFAGNNQIDLNNFTVDLTGNGVTTFNRLVTVSGLLTFTNGRLNMNNGTNLEVTNTGTVTGASRSSHVWGGKMKKTGFGSAFTFPVGYTDGSTRFYNPVTIEVSSGGSTDAYVAGYNHGNPSRTTKRNDIDDIPRRGNWTLQRTSGTDKSLSITAHSGTGFYSDDMTFTTAGYNTFARAFSDGWGKAVSSAPIMTTTGSVQTMKVTGILLGTASGSYNKQTTDYNGISTGMNNIVAASESNSMLSGSPSDPIDVGPSSSSGGASTLPVQLINFTAKLTPEKKVALNWTTATESVNKGFRIERQTVDLGNKFENIGFVNSKATGGNSQSNLYYNFLDNNPKPSAANHYRLVQEDLDGTLTYSEVRMIRLGGQSVSLVFPNPSAGNVTISRTDDGKKMNIQIIDLSGKVVREMNNISESYFKFNITQPGVYNIKMTYPETGEQSVQRVVVQR